MRYERLGDLLKLAIRLSGDAEGMTLEDVMQEMRVSRSTAERLLEALRQNFPQIESIPDGRKKRWRLPANAIRGLLAAETAELAELDAAARRLRDEGAASGRALALESLSAKLRTVLKPKELLRTGPDLELLMEAEGTAVRPGPRPQIADTTLNTIRQALLSSRRIRMIYASAGKAPNGVERIIEPLGLLHGQRPYLLARMVGLPPDPTMFRLDRILALEVLETSFIRDSSFKLAAFAARSFGVWRGDPVSVSLRFTAAAAAEAAAFHFHATQALRQQADGALLVTFEAEGMLEICQHLATWYDQVEILKPAKLRKMMASWSQDIASHHQQSPRTRQSGQTS
jgi:predicted DNA-binding transcriptional regulator YafY